MQVQQQPLNQVQQQVMAPPALVKRSSCREEIEKINFQREERRKRMQEDKKKRAAREKRNDAEGIKVDVDFQIMVEDAKQGIPTAAPVSYAAPRRYETRPQPNSHLTFVLFLFEAHTGGPT